MYQTMKLSFRYTRYVLNLDYNRSWVERDVKFDEEKAWLKPCTRNASATCLARTSIPIFFTCKYSIPLRLVLAQGHTQQLPSLAMQKRDVKIGFLKFVTTDAYCWWMIATKKIANNKNKCALWAPPATNRLCKTLWLEGTLGEILVTWKIKEAARFVMPAAEALSYIFQYGYVVPGNGMLLLQALKKIHRHAKYQKERVRRWMLTQPFAEFILYPLQEQ